MAAIGIMLSAALVGGGVDMSRAYRAENRLQSACDSAVLAGRKAVNTNGFDSSAEARADNFFDTNFNPDVLEASNTNFTATSDDNGNTVEGAASTRVRLSIMQIFGMSAFDLSVTCSASMGVGNSDVVMVLDNTGSMGSSLSGSTRIAALKSSMKNFYDTLELASGGSNARIRYGFVPYSSAVNVGHLLYAANPDYLVDSYTYQSRKPVYRTETQTVFDHWEEPVYTTDSSPGNSNYGSWNDYTSTTYSSNDSCETALPDDTAWEDHGPPTSTTTTYINGNGQQVQVTTTTQPQRRRDYDCKRAGNSHNRYYYRRYRYVYRDSDENAYATSDAVYTTTEMVVFDSWEYKPIVYDVSGYKTFASASTMTTTATGPDGYGEPEAMISTWEGCIEERETVAQASFSYSSIFGITPSGAKDLNIDLFPDATDDSTRWAPMWPEISYTRKNNSNYRTTSTTNRGNQATAYCPERAQLLAEMTEDEFDDYADSLRAVGYTYLDLGMIWGARLISREGIFQTNVNEAPVNDAEVARHIIFMTDGVMQTNDNIQTSYGIEYWDRRVTDNGSSNMDSRHTSRFLALCQAVKAKGVRVWVIAFTTSLTGDLTTCASSNSSFTANSSSDLNTAFQEIANQVGELRITQ